MTEFYIIRHGETDYNKNGLIQGRINTPLNKNGILQAHELGRYFIDNGIRFDKIITSPLRRAYATGIIIDCELGLGDCIISDDLTERAFGPMEGKEVSDEAFRIINSDTIDGIEKTSEIIKRSSNALIKLAKEYDGKKILIVSHSHVIKALAYMIDKNKYSFSLPLYNCGMSIFKCDGKTIKLAVFNKKTI